NPPDVLAMTGGSCAIHLSDLVWEGPMAGIRVGRIGGEFIAYPTFEQRKESDMDMVIAASRDAIVMVEGGFDEMPESVIIDALMFGHEAVQPVLDLQEKLRAAVGKPKRAYEEPAQDEALLAKVKELAWGKLEEAMSVREKRKRGEATAAGDQDVMAGRCGAGCEY